jgi:DNA-binding MarR family transcriptional regulator
MGVAELMRHVSTARAQLPAQRIGREGLEQVQVNAVVDGPGVEQGIGGREKITRHSRYTTAQDVNSPEHEQFEKLYGRLWRALHRPDDDDLSQHELELLHHVPAAGAGSVTLQQLARHLALPKSSASVLVKDLERRGFLSRARDPRNERQLAIALTAEGQARVAADAVLDLPRLAAALAALDEGERQALLGALQRLVEASELTTRQWHA